MPESRKREQIRRWVGYGGWLIAAAVIYVLIDFSVDLRPPAVQTSYRFNIPELTPNEPVFLRQDNYSVVVILRSRQSEYFVAHALGTDLGCPLQVVDDRFKESCGKASYDFSGRALTDSRNYQNLRVPEYKFSSDFKVLTVWP